MGKGCFFTLLIGVKTPLITYNWFLPAKFCHSPDPPFTPSEHVEVVVLVPLIHAGLILLRKDGDFCPLVLIPTDPFVAALNAREGYNLGAVCIFLGGTTGSKGLHLSCMKFGQEYYIT